MAVLEMVYHPIKGYREETGYMTKKASERC